MRLYNFIQIFIKGTGKLSDLEWLFTIFLITLITHRLYLKFMKRFLGEQNLPGEIKKGLVDVVWTLSYTAISVPFLLRCTNASLLDVFFVSSKWSDQLQNEMNSCKSRTQVTQQGVRTLFVLYSAFSILYTLDTWLLKGLKNLNFLQKQTIFAAFIVTYFSRCPLFGLNLILLTNRIALTEFMAKFVALIGEATNSRVLKGIAKLLCACHLAIWGETILYNLPTYLTNNKNISSSMMYTELKAIIVLDFLIWIYIATCLLNSVFNRAILCMVVSSETHPCTLEYVLFGQRDEQIDMSRLVDGGGEVNRENPKTKRYMKMLSSTIKCSIMVKRKLRRMRERKSLESGNVL